MVTAAYEQLARPRRFTCVKPSSLVAGVIGGVGVGSVGDVVCTIGAAADKRACDSRLVGGGGGGGRGMCRLSRASILLKIPESEESTFEVRDSRRAITGSAFVALGAWLLAAVGGLGVLRARGAGEGDGSLRRRGGGLAMAPGVRGESLVSRRGFHCSVLFGLSPVCPGEGTGVGTGGLTASVGWRTVPDAVRFDGPHGVAGICGVVGLSPGPVTVSPIPCATVQIYCLLLFFAAVEMVFSRSVWALRMRASFHVATLSSISRWAVFLMASSKASLYMSMFDSQSIEEEMC